MIRTQIQLTEDHIRRLKKLARQQGVSLAEMVRRCVIYFLDREGPRRKQLYEKASSLVGAFEDREGASDVGKDHDRYLDEAFR